MPRYKVQIELDGKFTVELIARDEDSAVRRAEEYLHQEHPTIEWDVAGAFSAEII